MKVETVAAYTIANAALITAMGMQAENDFSKILGHAPVYREADFDRVTRTANEGIAQITKNLKDKK